MKEYKEEIYENPSLLEVFRQGDRVKQVYYDPNGYERIYSGTIVNIKKHCMAIHWDYVNGNPSSDMREIYCVFHISEVFNGDEYYSPITKEE